MKTIDVDLCISFPGSGRTWLLIMLHKNGLYTPLAFTHGVMTNKTFTVENQHVGFTNRTIIFSKFIKNKLKLKGCFIINYKRVIFLWRNPFDILCSVNDKFDDKTPHELAIHKRPLTASFKEDRWSPDKLKANFKHILEYHIAVIEYCKQYNIPIYYVSYHDLLKENTFIDLCNYLGCFDLDKIKSVYKKYSIDNIFELPEGIIERKSLRRKINVGPDRDYRKIIPKELINSLQEIISELDYNNKVAAKFNVVL